MEFYIRYMFSPVAQFNYISLCVCVHCVVLGVTKTLLRGWGGVVEAMINPSQIFLFNITSFFRFVEQRAILRWYNLIRTCAGECD
jgi:hypothetical protein